MRLKRPLSSLRDIKSIHAAGLRSIPKVQRSDYLDLYMLGREKDRLEKELCALDKRRTAAARQADSVTRRIIQLQKETGEEDREKAYKSIHAKPLRTMPIKY